VKPLQNELAPEKETARAAAATIMMVTLFEFEEQGTSQASN
jgi:hypothetical protein